MVTQRGVYWLVARYGDVCPGNAILKGWWTLSHCYPLLDLQTTCFQKLQHQCSGTVGIESPELMMYWQLGRLTNIVSVHCPLETED